MKSTKEIETNIQNEETLSVPTVLRPGEKIIQTYPSRGLSALMMEETTDDEKRMYNGADSVTDSIPLLFFAWVDETGIGACGSRVVGFVPTRRGVEVCEGNPRFHGYETEKPDPIHSSGFLKKIKKMLDESESKKP